MGQFQVLFKVTLVYIKEKSIKDHRNTFKRATHEVTLVIQSMELSRSLFHFVRALTKQLLKT